MLSGRPKSVPAAAASELIYEGVRCEQFSAYTASYALAQSLLLIVPPQQWSQRFARAGARRHCEHSGCGNGSSVMSESEEELTPLYPLLRPGPFISGTTGDVLQLGQRIAAFEGEGTERKGGAGAAQVQVQWPVQQPPRHASGCFSGLLALFKSQTRPR